MLNQAVTADQSQLVQLDADKPAVERGAESDGNRRPLFGLDGSALAALMVEVGQPAWRGKQISKAIYCQRAMDLSEITTLPKLLRQKLFDDGWEVGRPRIVQAFRSVDGTDRYLVQCTAGAETVETVWMPDGDDGEAGDGSDSGEQDIRAKGATGKNWNRATI